MNQISLCNIKCFCLYSTAKQTAYVDSFVDRGSSQKSLEWLYTFFVKKMTS